MVEMQPAESDERPVVLVIDDDADIRDALRDVLEVEGFAVVEAADGQQALNYLYGHAKPAVILLDLFMPVMNGWEFARHLRSHSQLCQIPVIAVTASGPYWGYPVERVIRKPLSAQDVVQSVIEFKQPH